MTLKFMKCLHLRDFKWIFIAFDDGLLFLYRIEEIYFYQKDQLFLTNKPYFHQDLP